MATTLIVSSWGESTALRSAATPDADISAEQATKRQQRERRLWWWNLVCGCAHLVQGVAALVIGLRASQVSNFRLPLTTAFTDWSRGFPLQQLQTRGTIPFAAVTSGFALMSAAAHFTVLALFPVYVADLRRGINRFRWYEYAASSSLMIGLIAMLFGVYDIITLVSIMSVNACMNLFGLLMELHNQHTDKTDWTAFWCGCFAGAVPWAVIFAYLGGIGNAASTVPGFVWAILIVYIGFFNCFPVNMVLQYMRVGWWAPKEWSGRGSDGYYYGETVYQVLSLVSKSLLTWLVIGGVNQPNQYTAQ